MQKYIFIKTVSDKCVSYTTLSDLLKSEGLYHIYASIARRIRRNPVIQHGEITISKVELIHTKYKK